MKFDKLCSNNILFLILLCFFTQIPSRDLCASDAASSSSGIQEKQKEAKQTLIEASDLKKADYFEIAQAIANKAGGRKLILRNILRDHTGDNPDKSYFYEKEETKINAMIDEILKDPSYIDFSRSTGRLMIIKDFSEVIGIHRTPQGEKIESNRVTLFFGNVPDIIKQGKPWDGKMGVLLTGFPDNPKRKYS